MPMKKPMPMPAVAKLTIDQALTRLELNGTFQRVAADLFRLRPLAMAVPATLQTVWWSLDKRTRHDLQKATPRPEPLPVVTGCGPTSAAIVTGDPVAGAVRLVEAIVDVEISLEQTEDPVEFLTLHRHRAELIQASEVLDELVIEQEG